MTKSPGKKMQLGKVTIGNGGGEGLRRVPRIQIILSSLINTEYNLISFLTQQTQLQLFPCAYLTYKHCFINTQNKYLQRNGEFPFPYVLSSCPMQHFMYRFQTLLYKLGEAEFSVCRLSLQQGRQSKLWTLK